MNVKKTKTMIISRKPEGKSVQIEVGDEILQQVHNYIYLGTEISEEIKSDKLKSVVILPKKSSVRWLDY